MHKPVLVLHGREREVLALRSALDDVTAGRGRVVLVEGEAGIGKTRLIEEMIAEARSRSIQTYLGTCEELERARPFQALTDALDIGPRSTDPARRDIAELLQRRAPDDRALQPLAIAPELQFRIADAIAELLETTSAQGPILLVVQDVQWADAATLAFLRSARRLAHVPIVLVATFRPTLRSSDLDLVVDRLGAEGAAHLHLHPLDESAVAAVATDILGGPPGDTVAADLRSAAGNPFYVIELCRALQEEGSIEIVDGRAEGRRHGIPSTLRLTVLRRMAVLPSETLELVKLASVLGASFDLRDLAAVAGRGVTEILEPLGPAVQSAVLGDRGERLAFRHDLVREAIYDDIPPAIRRDLEREVGRKLADTGAPAQRVAAHMMAAAEPNDEEAVSWLRRAAREAGPQSVQIAVELLESALALCPAHGALRDEVLAELLVRLVHVGRPEGAEKLARELLATSPPPDVETLAREALAISLTQQGRSVEARDQWQAVAESPWASDVRRAVALSDMSQAALQGADADAAADLATRALEIGERVDDANSVCTALMTLSAIAVGKADTARAVEQAQRAVDLVDRVWRSADAYPIPELILAMALIDADRLEEAAVVARTGRQRSEERGLRSQVPLYQWAMCAINFFAGRWDDAIAEAEAGITICEETGFVAGLLIPRATTARIALSRGDVDEAERHLRAGEGEVVASGPTYGFDLLQWCRGLMHELSGDVATAVAVIGVGWDVMASVRYHLWYRSIATDFVRLALMAGDAARAQAVADEVEEGARRSGTSVSLAVALRCRGLIDRDCDALRRSVDAFRKGSRPFDLALALEDLGSMLSDRTEAVARLEEALAIYDELGSRREASRTEQVLRELGVRRGRRGKRGRATFGWESLTPTEVKVMKLAVEGLTSPQIGARLFISPRTVGTHLRNVFAKLGVSSRVELTAKAMREFNRVNG